MLTTTRLKELFDYRETGDLVRKIANSRNSKVGEVVGWTHPDGYRQASVDGVTYMLHHIVWVWHGNESVPELDHKDLNKGNCRIGNLRPATHSQNMYNRGIQKNSTTGVKGVVWKKDKNAYCVRLGVAGRRLHLGYFDDLELAELVAAEARAKYHGAFANTH